MDRFELFHHIKDLIQYSEAYFVGKRYNPFQVLVSPLYLGILNESIFNRDGEQISIAKENNYVQLLKRRIKSIRDQLIYRASINKYSLKGPVLFFPVEPTHIIQFKPVWEIFLKKRKPFLIVTNRIHIFRSLKQQYPIIFTASFRRIKNEQEFKELHLLQRQVLTDYELVNQGRLPLKKIHLLLQIHESNAWSLSHQLIEIMDLVKPVAIVAGYDITYEGRLLTLLAKDRKISTNCIMHGSITGEPLDTMHIVDHFYLFGEAAKKDLISKGTPASQLVVTGAPYLDQIEYSNKNIHPLLKKNILLTESKPYFLIAMSGPGHSTSYAHFQVILENLFAIAAKYPEVQWVIKMHRKDQIENYKEVLNRYSDHKIHIVKHNEIGFPKSIFQWLQGATVLLTGTSTVAVEAMAIGIPVITMDFMKEYKMVDFIDLGSTIHVTNTQQLEVSVENIVKKPEVYKSTSKKAAIYASQFFYKSGASASERIVQYIESDQ